MASGDSFSCVSVARPLEGGHSQAASHRLRAGAYYSHLLAHTSSFSDLIEAERSLTWVLSYGELKVPRGRRTEKHPRSRLPESPGKAKTRLLALSILDIRCHSQFRWTTPLHCRLLRHMHIPCIMYSLTKRRRLISRPRQLLSSRYLRNKMLLLRFSKVDPRLQDLLNRLNGLLLFKYNRAMLLNLVSASSIRLYQLLPLTYSSNSLRGIGLRQRRLVPTLIQQRKIKICAMNFIRVRQEISIPFIIDYPPAKVAFASAPFVIEVPAKEPYQDRRVPWDYGGKVANMEQEMNAMGITRSGRVYQGPELANKGKTPVATFSAVPETLPLPLKKVIDQEAKAFMKVIKVFFIEDELPYEGQGHLRALHMVCKCNNHVVGRVMINSGSALNICPVSTLKQMNVDMSRIRASKTTV
ncbi:hypothetical protein CRG98_021288 [Punica granatum]|uniref:Uncharacterized protein n=1 Tax=Punica granatum TaxID=22663 RepID=A0A2I0JPY4_PUNGR|nr:hypothetical protein CRG98_021288 [Punica granatum]